MSYPLILTMSVLSFIGFIGGQIMSGSTLEKSISYGVTAFLVTLSSLLLAKWYYNRKEK